ncbi:hypothetical protein ACI2OX_19945 [Bacillus sp. N9]
MDTRMENRWQVTDVLSTLKRGSDLIDQSVQTSPSSPEHWIQRIRDAYQTVSVKNYYQLDDWARIRYMRLLGFAPVEREWKPLFQLFAAYESIQLMNKVCDDLNKRRHLISFMQYMIEEADEALAKLTTIASPLRLINISIIYVMKARTYY